MSDPVLTPEILARAIKDKRWTALTRTGVDLATIATWDGKLARNTRILVPCDVQAFVVPATGGESTVPIQGRHGDPAPFAAGAPRPAGVHLHWAMPDALLRGTQEAVSEGGRTTSRLRFPDLPDRWVVVRALMPTGKSAALLRGWVIDARARTVTPLATFNGIPIAGSDATKLDPLNAVHGGSPLWTASYQASAGRFGFHDPLDDLPGPGSAAAPTGLAGDQAAYIVAGWWNDLGQDPLAQSVGADRLEARVAQLGWLLTHDDRLQREADPQLKRVQSKMKLKSAEEMPAVHATSADGHGVSALGEVEIKAALPVVQAAGVALAPALPRYATMVHGAVLGVPVGVAPPAGVDDRPPSSDLAVALGFDLDDLVAAFGKSAFGSTGANRRALERLSAAFTADLLDRLGSADGIADLDEREHGDQFTSLPGTPLPGAKPDRLRAEDTIATGPHDVGRKGRAAARAERPTKKHAGGKAPSDSATLRWKRDVDLVEKSKSPKGGSGSSKADPARSGPIGDNAANAKAGRAARTLGVREVTRPAPRFFRPQPPMVAIRGAHPNHRHHGDGLFDDEGLLRCRYPAECVPGWDGVVSGEVVVPSLGSGAVPEEVLALVREAVILNPYSIAWLAAAGAAKNNPAAGTVFQTRLTGEMVRLYGTNGLYDGSSHLAVTEPHAAASAWATVSQSQQITDRALAGVLADFSILPGTPPSPVAITTWRQPWVPLWVEWRVTLQGSPRVEGWTLGDLDLLPPVQLGDGETLTTFTFVGRNPIGQGLSTALQKAIARQLDAEARRDGTGNALITDRDQSVLQRLGDFLGPLDLVSASMDGIREQLLGLSYVGCAEYTTPGPNAPARPVASGLPAPLFGGTLRLDEARLVDAFGRTLSIPVDTLATTTDLELANMPNGIRMRPRILHEARWLFRLVDPALPAGADPATAGEAFVDQLAPELAVNPVVGFLLPDHIDEALEVFAADGKPLGQLGHDAVTGAVGWEPAPGRPLPPDAGPLADLAAHERLAGELAAGLIRADVASRSGGEDTRESALSALLRAIDSTLWSIDTFAAVGSPTVAGLIGRPVAVVRATVRLDAPDDLGDVVVTAEGGADARAAAFAGLAEQRFPFQLGTLHRSDDSLLGFFVDDDYEHFHIVDKVVASAALASGRHRGHLGLLGEGATPTVEPLDHPYIVADDMLWIRPGQTTRLTLLMLPAGKVHLTSGIVPRKALALCDDWVTPGLARLMPSVRVGPLVVDPSEIRLPLVNILGDKQTFTRRTGPLTWRDDPIVAATQTALLPRLPHEVQEGWIRVIPEDPSQDPSDGSGSDS